MPTGSPEDSWWHAAGDPLEWCGTIPYSEEYSPDARIRSLARAQDAEECWECGEPVEYDSWEHYHCKMRRFNGVHVQVLVPEYWLDNPAFTPEVRRKLVDGADWLYQYYTDLVGREPGGSGLLPIAVVPHTCGWGCGLIGGKGIEIGDDNDCCGGTGNRVIWREAEAGRINNVIVHEMAHNFDVFGGYIEYGDDAAHYWTDLINIDFHIRSRLGTSSYSSFLEEHSPAEFQDHYFDWSLWPYLDFEDHSWDLCVEQAACKDAGIYPKETRAVWLHRLAWHYGPAVMDRFIEEVKGFAATHQPPSTDQGKEDVVVEALAAAAGVDLVPCVDTLSWSLSNAARSRISASFDPDGFCRDEDGDGQTPFEGDCDDADATIFRGAMESPNGKDDNCNGVVDEVIDDISGAQPQHASTVARLGSDIHVDVTTPVTVLGNAETTNWVWLETDVPDDTRLRVTLCGEDGSFGGFAVSYSPHFGDYPFYTWTPEGRCGTFFPQYRSADHLQITVRPYHTGKWSITLSPTQEWSWRDFGGTVDVVVKPSGHMVFTFRTEDPSVFLSQPKMVRFWVFRHGWVGSVPYAAKTTYEWTPPASLAPGTYGVRAQAFDGTVPVSPITDIVWFDIADSLDDAFDSEVLVPAAARVSGYGGTTWVSDLVLHNPGDLTVNARLSFLRQGYSNDYAGLRIVNVPPGRSIRLNDVVGGFFGENEAAGAIRVASRNALIVTSRTYNDDDAGTYGQFIPAVAQGAELRSGERLVLLQLVSNSRFRTALGAVNLSEKAAKVHFDVFDGEGRLLGTHEEELQPYGAVQINKAIRGLGAGSVDNAYVVASLAEGEGGVHPYASVVDNGSGDPVFVLPSEVSDNTLYVPASAHVAGFNGTHWRTDLVVANPGNTTAGFSIQLLEAGRDNSVYREKSFELAGGKAARYGDILQELFGFTGTGSLRIVAAKGEIAVASRTYNDDRGGTYGQSIPGTGLARALAGGQEGRLVQLAYSGDRSQGFRTNIGFLNPTSNDAKATLQLHSGDGELLGSQDVELKPFSYMQLNDVFRDTERQLLEDAFAVVVPDASTSRLFAYASVVDNRSGDPVYLSAVPGVDSPLVFPDPELDRCVRGFLGVEQPSPVFPEDVEELTRFACWGYPIQSLDGLEHMQKLQRLVVSFGEVEDIAAVASLKRLRHLSFESNHVADLNAVASLPDLRTLDIRGNNVQDLSPLSALSNLTQLWAYSNEITSVEPLANLPRLDDISVDWNQLEDIQPLVENEDFGRFLNVVGNNLDENDCPAILALQDRGTEVHFSPQREGDLVCDTQ